MIETANIAKTGFRTLVRILGQFSITHDNRLVCDGLERRKHARLLLTLLAAEDSLTRQRESLLRVLWPQLEASKANNRLHQTLHWLRRDLEIIPEQDRPAIRLGEKSVQLLLPDTVNTDIRLLRAIIDTDTTEPAARLSELTNALTLFGKGEIADGIDNWEVDSLRSRLQLEQLAILKEASAIALELGDSRLALEFSVRLYELPDAPYEFRLDHVRLLCACGRADAAIATCEQLRSDYADDPEAYVATSDLAQIIRRETNVTHSHDVLDTLEPDRQTPALSSTGELHGYASAREACLQALNDPHSNILTVIGPNGCGKSLFVLNAAVQVQQEYAHGCLRIENEHSDTIEEFESRILKRFSAAFDSHITPARDGRDLAERLIGLNMLLVIDGQAISSSVAAAISNLAAINRDIRWLIASTNPLYCRGERIIELDPSSLQQTYGEPYAPGSPALKIIAQAAGSGFPNDSGSLAILDAAAETVDSLPASLIDLGHLLRTHTASELAHLLESDPIAIIDRNSEPAPKTINALESAIEKLSQASAECRRLIVTLSQFRTWLSRADLLALSGVDDGEPFNKILQKGRSQHWLKRRVEIRNGRQISLFRLSFIATLAAFEFNKEARLDSNELVEHWLLGLRDALPLSRHKPPTTEKLHWFERNLPTIQTVINRWIADRNLAQVAHVCLIYGSRWKELTCASQILDWLQQIDGVPKSSDGRHLALILFHRAALRVALSDEAQGVSDALRAIGIACKHDFHYLCDDATRLIHQVETTRRDVTALSTRLVNRRGLQAGASLMRSAQLAIRVNEYKRAAIFLDEAIRLFDYFDMPHCALSAYIYRSQLGYSTGNLELLTDCAVNTRKLSAKSGIEDFRYWALALEAKRELARGDFSTVIATCSKVCSFADSNFRGRAELGISAMITAAWANYGLGAFRVARSYCDDILGRSHHRVSAEQRIELLMLLALSQARLDDRSAALRAVLDVRRRIEHFSVDLDRQTLGTAAAELAALLDRADLATLIAQEVDRHVGLVNCKLRPWTAIRLAALEKLCPSPRSPVQTHSRGNRISSVDNPQIADSDHPEVDVERFLTALSSITVVAPALDPEALPR